VNPASIVVDTNILFSLLLRGETALRKRFLTDSTLSFKAIDKVRTGSADCAKPPRRCNLRGYLG
jgi:hypothetical protein